MEQLKQVIYIFVFYLFAQLPAMAAWQAQFIPGKLKLLLVVFLTGLLTILVGEDFRRKLSLEPSGLGLRPPVPWKPMGYAAAVLVCVAAGLAWFSIYFTAYRQVFPDAFAKLMLEDGSGILSSLAQWQKDSPVLGLAALLGSLLFLAAAEEYLFRGIIYNYLLRSLSPRKAILWSSVSFALFHLKPVNMPISLVGGILYCWLYRRTGSLLAPVLAHSLYNFGLVMFGERLVIGL
jgi:membrane protease YdiL (CAAX protease family)